MREATLAQQRMLDDLKDLERYLNFALSSSTTYVTIDIISNTQVYCCNVYSQLWNECEAHGSCRMEVERLTEQVSRLQVKIQHMQKEKKEVCASLHSCVIRS